MYRYLNHNYYRLKSILFATNSTVPCQLAYKKVSLSMGLLTSLICNDN